MSTSRPELTQLCKRCSAELAPGALNCAQCQALVHAGELEQLSANAKALEAQGKLREARDLWLSAMPLLPANSQQAIWIKDHAIDLYARALEMETSRSLPQAQKPADHSWAKKFGPLAPLLILLAKAKSLLVLFKFKFLFTLFAFIGFYWSVFGAWFGVGFAILVLIHEMGHFIEVRRRHLPAEMPVFLPGLGAYVKWQAMGVSLEVRSMVSLAGPLAGLLSSAACVLIYFKTGSMLWLALARAGAWLNVMNLIPVWVLDGGQAVHAVNRAGRIQLMVVALSLWWIQSETLFLFVAAGAAYQTFFVPPPKEGSQKISFYFAALLLGLAVVLWLAPGKGFGMN